MKRRWWILAIILLLVAAGLGWWFFHRPSRLSDLPPGNLVDLNQALIGGNNASDSAQVGSISDNTPINGLSADMAAKGLTEDDVLGIRKGLAVRFGLSVDKIQITLGEDSTSEFATGYVNVGEGDRGGIYFAAKTDDGWQIAHDGRGVVECSTINQYEFPTGIVPRCYDAETGLSINR